MSKRVLNVEVLGVVEDSDDIARVCAGSRVGSSITTLGRDGNGVERDGRLSDFGHDEMVLRMRRVLIDVVGVMQCATGTVVSTKSCECLVSKL